MQPACDKSTPSPTQSSEIFPSNEKLPIPSLSHSPLPPTSGVRVARCRVRCPPSVHPGNSFQFLKMRGTTVSVVCREPTTFNSRKIAAYLVAFQHAHRSCGAELTTVPAPDYQHHGFQYFVEVASVSTPRRSRCREGRICSTSSVYKYIRLTRTQALACSTER